MWHVLKPTKQRFTKHKVFGFDIETSNNNKDFYCASIVGDNFSKFFYDKQELINEFKKDRFRNSIISATNLGFDFFGTFHETPEVMKFNTLFRGSDLLLAKTYIKNKDFHSKNVNGANRLLFLDTLNYAKMSVAKLGKILNIPKLDHPKSLGRLPVNKEEIDELKVYNLRDSEISQRFMKFLIESFEKLGATFKPTIASTSMSLFKNKYLKDSYFRADPHILTEQFNAYYGGRTEVFKRGHIKNMNYYDFNSLYPSVMIDNEFPNPNTMRTNRMNTLEYIREYDGISLVTVSFSGSLPLLPLRYDNKLVFPTGKFTAWYSHVELRKALSEGYKILKVQKTYYFKENCKPFHNYVNDLYNLRLKFKAEGSSMEQVTKLLLNSLYGKFGQKFENKDNWVPFNLTKEELDKFDYIERHGDFLRVVKDFTVPSSFCIPIWALYVTAYARIKLYDCMKLCDPVYCDTDSVITSMDLPTSNKLGDLKLEMSVHDGIIVKPKMYALNTSVGEYVKIKGVGTQLDNARFDKLLLEPSVTYDKFMKLKESMRRGFIPNEIQSITKNLDLEDSKRVWKGVFNPKVLQNSKPLNLLQD